MSYKGLPQSAGGLVQAVYVQSVIPPELDVLLIETLEDEVMSRKERRSLRDLLQQTPLSEAQRQELQTRAFVLAQSKITSAPERVLSWIEAVVKVIRQSEDTETQTSEAYFSPGDRCLNALLRYMRNTRTSADICVFTITDNRLAEGIYNMHQRGIQVRIISDNEKMFDRGSDVEEFARAGIPVCYDNTEHHMHHKYALFDAKILITGSYNWTRSAATSNQENIVVSSDARLLRLFRNNFEDLWWSLQSI